MRLSGTSVSVVLPSIGNRFLFAFFFSFLPFLFDSAHAVIMMGDGTSIGACDWE